MRIGTKLVVATGLLLMAAFYLWVSTVVGHHRLRATIAAQMVAARARAWA